MTERRPARPSQSGVGVWLGSAVGFVAVLAVLSWQVAAGRDPAIGAGSQAAASPPVQRVLVRRIVRRVIVTEDAPRTAPASSGSGGSSAPAPAPADQAPAAPAPAPAPAAPTTRAS